jgi:hypothetical protein
MNYIFYQIVLSRVRVVTIRRGMDWMIEFIDHLYTPHVTARNYSATAYIYILQFIATHTLLSSVSNSRCLATDFNT